MNNTTNDNDLIYTTRGSEKRSLQHAYKVGAYESLLTMWIARGYVPGLEALTPAQRTALKDFVERQVSLIEKESMSNCYIASKR